MEHVRLEHILRPGDLGAIIALHGTVYAQEYGLDNSFEAYVAVPLGACVAAARAQDRIWIARSGDQIAGCIAIVNTQPHEAQLRWFLVHPSFRGMGLGRQLMEHAIAFCRLRGYHEVFLWTISALTTAAAIYRRFGFQMVEEKPGRQWGIEVVEEKYVLRLP